MKMNRWLRGGSRGGIRIWLVSAAALLVVGGATAAYKADFKLGQNIEMVVAMMRGIWLYYVDPVDATTLGKDAAAGMVRSLDPYSELIHSDDQGDFELMTTGKYGGIGAVIRQHGEWVQVAEPYAGTPSARAGLEIGDVFLEVAGRDAHGMTTAEVSTALKGEVGTEVTIRVRKFYTGEEQTLTLTRQVIALPAVPYYGILHGVGARDSIGYIHHSEFTEGSADDFRTALGNLKAQGAKALVLDYRSNGGGIMQEAVKVLSYFVPRGTEVVSMRGRGEGTNRSYRTTSEPLDSHIPIVVLVDDRSASAAEIVAGALQDLDRAVLIGQRTFGKGLVQSTLPLGYDSALKITTAKYYIPSGRCIQAIDYSHHEDENGQPMAASRRAIPDSLIQEFHTAGGRKVYDGGGVMPDIRIEPQYNSRFAIVAYGKGYIDDFADQWNLRNRESRDVVPGVFELSEQDYAEFVEFLADKDLEYESASKQALTTLRQNAEYERYMTPELKAQLDAIGAALRDDNATGVALYREELSDLIESAIVLRRHHSAGVAAHAMVDDPDIHEAVKVLNDRALYDEILTQKDTDRK